MHSTCLGIMQRRVGSNRCLGIVLEAVLHGSLRRVTAREGNVLMFSFVNLVDFAFAKGVVMYVLIVVAVVSVQLSARSVAPPI